MEKSSHHPETAQSTFHELQVQRSKPVSYNRTTASTSTSDVQQQKMSKTQDHDLGVRSTLTDDEEGALVDQYRHYLAYHNIVGIGVEQRKTDGKVRDVLVFLVKKKKQDEMLSESERVPKKAWTDSTNCGHRIEVDTDVVETGEISAQCIQGGSAVAAVDPRNDILGHCTIGAIMPFRVEGDKPGENKIRLLTSAHLIDYDEQHRGKRLHCITREEYREVEQSPEQIFLHEAREVFCINSFCPVTMYTPVPEEELPANPEYSKHDVLWADGTSSSASETRTIAGRHPLGIRRPRKGEWFNMHGIKSGMHRAKVESCSYSIRLDHKDSDGRVRSCIYWESLTKYNLERHTIPGDSGAALMADDGKVIGLHSIGPTDVAIPTPFGFACWLPQSA